MLFSALKGYWHRYSHMELYLDVCALQCFEGGEILCTRKWKTTANIFPVISQRLIPTSYTSVVIKVSFKTTIFHFEKF